MHSKRDQVQAHTFMVGRLVSAVLQGDPDLAVTPLRRTPVGLLIGTVLAALAVGGLVALGLLIPGGATGWRKPGTLIVEKQTGTRYVLIGGRLRPVLNYASARLLLSSKLTIDVVPTKSLAGVPRGAPVGIPGAPDVLPGPGKPAATPWLVCATAPDTATGTATGTGAAGGRRPGLAVAVGSGIDAHPLTDRQAILVRAENGTAYLAWRGTRLRLSADWVGGALGFDAAAAVPVPDAWLDPLPAGPDLGPLPVDGRGGPGPVLDGEPTVVGQLFVVHAGGQPPRYYLLTAGGLQPTTATGAALALGDPASAVSYPDQPALPRELSPAALATATVLPEPDWAAQLPASPPALAASRGDQAPCVRAVPGQAGPAVSAVTVPVGTPGGSAVDGPALTRDARTADRVDVRPGSSLLARTAPAPGVPGVGLYLVTEDGAKYPVASPAAAEALGYPAPTAVGVPADLLALLPTGPVLDQVGTGGGARLP